MRSAVLSSQHTHVWVRINDCFKPLSVGVACYMALSWPQLTDTPVFWNPAQGTHSPREHFLNSKTWPNSKNFGYVLSQWYVFCGDWDRDCSRKKEKREASIAQLYHLKTLQTRRARTEGIYSRIWFYEAGVGFMHLSQSFHKAFDQDMGLVTLSLA